MSKVFKKVKKVVKKAAPVIGAVVGNAIAPGIGGVIGGGIGGAASGGGLKGALLGAAGGGLSSALGTVAGSTLAGGVGPTQGSGLLGALTRGSSGLSGALSSGVKGLSALTGIGGAETLGGGSKLLSSLLGSARTVGGGSDIGRLALNVASGLSERDALKQAAKQQLTANQQAINTVSPFLQSGTAATNQINALLGLDPNADQEEILNALRGTPSFQFAQDQGQQQINRSLGARGQLFSGRALKEAQRFGQGLAEQTLQQQLSNLRAQQATGIGAAGQVVGLQGQAGDILANRDLERTNALNRSLANILVPRG